MNKGTALPGDRRRKRRTTTMCSHIKVETRFTRFGKRPIPIRGARLDAPQPDGRVNEQDVLLVLQRWGFMKNTAEKNCWPVEAREDWQFIDTFGVVWEPSGRAPAFTRQTIGGRAVFELIAK